MVGGHALGISNERVYRFEFPERPGALLEFLSGLGKKWNISLFHYRNHGAAFGRVMVGVQIDAGEKKAFQAFLTQLGYAFSEETDNPAYTLFAFAILNLPSIHGHKKRPAFAGLSLVNLTS